MEIHRQNSICDVCASLSLALSTRENRDENLGIGYHTNELSKQQHNTFNAMLSFYRRVFRNDKALSVGTELVTFIDEGYKRSISR